jgi:hypothetical protein
VHRTKLLVPQLIPLALRPLIGDRINVGSSAG